MIMSKITKKADKAKIIVKAAWHGVLSRRLRNYVKWILEDKCVTFEEVEDTADLFWSLALFFFTCIISCQPSLMKRTPAFSFSSAADSTWVSSTRLHLSVPFGTPGTFILLVSVILFVLFTPWAVEYGHVLWSLTGPYRAVKLHKRMKKIIVLSPARQTISYI